MPNRTAKGDRPDRTPAPGHILLALWTQYLSLGVLALYGILRAVVCRGAPLGTYCGPLALLWPLSYGLLLVSWMTDQLWREKGA